MHTLLSEPLTIPPLPKHQTKSPNLSLLHTPPLTSTTYSIILQSSNSLTLGKQLHSHSTKTGFHNDNFVQTKLLQMYTINSSFEDACHMFDKMTLRNLHSWTAVLRLHLNMGLFQKGFILFEEFLFDGLGEKLDFFVFPVVLNICCGLGELGLGRQVHGMVLKHGFVSNVYVGNALIDMYGKCGSLGEAKKVLEGMTQKDCVSWNSIITACVANEMVYEALDLLENMLLSELEPNIVNWSAVIGGFSSNGYDVESVELLARMVGAGEAPNARTLASVLPACARMKWLFVGKELHGYIVRHDLFSNGFVVNALVDMYRRCGDMKCAFEMFSKFARKCAASYNTMIVGYLENGNIIKAKEFFDQWNKRVWRGIE